MISRQIKIINIAVEKKARPQKEDLNGDRLAPDKEISSICSIARRRRTNHTWGDEIAVMQGRVVGNETAQQLETNLQEDKANIISGEPTNTLVWKGTQLGDNSQENEKKTDQESRSVWRDGIKERTDSERYQRFARVATSGDSWSSGQDNYDQTKSSDSGALRV